MKKGLVKTVSITLCATILSLSTTCITPAFAATTSSTEETGTDNKFVPSILQKVEVSKIPKDHVYIPAKTKIQLELIETISSKTAHTGDPVKFKALTNLIINDVVVISAGSIANGTVTKARSAGGMGRGGKLEFSIKSIDSLNQVEVPLTYSSSVSGSNDGGAVAVVAVVSIIGGLFMKGSNVSCPVGSKIDAIIPEDTDLNVTFDNLADAMNPAKPHGVVILLKQ